MQTTESILHIWTWIRPSKVNLWIFFMNFCFEKTDPQDWPKGVWGVGEHQDRVRPGRRATGRLYGSQGYASNCIQVRAITPFLSSVSWKENLRKNSLDTSGECFRRFSFQERRDEFSRIFERFFSNRLSTVFLQFFDSFSTNSYL